MVDKWDLPIFLMQFYIIYVTDKWVIYIYLNKHFLLILTKNNVPKYYDCVNYE